jgi:hypothetical protein
LTNKIEQQGEGKQQHRLVVDERINTMPTATTTDEIEAAQCLAELIEFAILRLMRLGDLALCELGLIKEGGLRGFVNPIHRATSERPLDTLKPWEPWRELQKSCSKINATQQQKTEKSENWPSILPNSGISSWLHKSMANASIYEETYLELAECCHVF